MPTELSRILIVDDEPSVAHAIVLLIGMLGYEGVECFSPADAVQLMTNESFDLLITDYRMPHMNGLELISLLRNNKCNVPTILMTAFSSNIDTAKAADLGVITILHKPFSTSQLKQILRAVVKQPITNDNAPEKLVADLCNEWIGDDIPSSETESEECEDHS